MHFEERLRQFLFVSMLCGESLPESSCREPMAAAATLCETEARL